MGVSIKGKRSGGNADDGKGGAQVRQEDGRDIEAVRGATHVPPDGPNGLFKMVDGERVALKDDEPVTLLNVSLASAVIKVPDPSYKTDPGKERLQNVRIPAFGWYETTAKYARRALSGTVRLLPGTNVHYPRRLVLKVDRGDCKGEHTFSVRPDDTHPYRQTEWATCPYSHCPTCGGDKPWSVLQIQRLISSLGSEDAIQGILDIVDARQPVAQWAYQRRAIIQHQMEIRLGMLAPGGRAAKSTRVH